MKSQKIQMREVTKLTKSLRNHCKVIQNNHQKSLKSQQNHMREITKLTKSLRNQCKVTQNNHQKSLKSQQKSHGRNQ